MARRENKILKYKRRRNFFYLILNKNTFLRPYYKLNNTIKQKRFQ